MATLADLKVEECKKCRRYIYWLANDNTGKMAPIDARPAVDGPVIIRSDGGQLLYHVLTKDEIAGGLGDGVSRHTNHFQTCPNANDFRKARRL